LRLQNQWNDLEHVGARHFFIDDLLNREAAMEIYQGFLFDEKIWNRVSNFRERKGSFQKIDILLPVIGAITDAFHSQNVIDIVSTITGIKGLEADPSLYAGGISMMKAGDFLNPHLDNSHDGQKRMYRRLNLLYYATPDWDESLGGSLELWDNSVEKSLRITARFNRLLVMETNHLSWHSVDKIIGGGIRTCVSNYYFTRQSPLEKDYYHVTSFVGRPGENFRRIYGRIDNFLRQAFVNLTGVGRGSLRGRY
jgi:Rps23 Pro-64 3,4-dihydroxylase Tpa1-like proline 4-hydroxylase